MKAILFYIFFLLPALLTVSFNDSRNNQPLRDIQSCHSHLSNSGVYCTLPEAVASLKRIPCGQLFSDIFHRSHIERLIPDRIKMPVQAVALLKRPATFVALGQRVSELLIFTRSSEEDPHLENK